MKTKTIKLMALLLAMLLILAACGSKNSEKTPLPDDLTTLIGTGTPVTDTVQIEKIWDEYICRAITCLQRDFRDPSEIDFWDMISFVTYRYFADHTLEGLPTMEVTLEAGTEWERTEVMHIWGADQVSEYLWKYFQYKVTDKNFYKSYESGRYDVDVEGILLPSDYQPNNDDPYTMENNPFGIYVEFMEKLPSGDLLVSMCSNFYNTDLVNSRQLYVLSPNANSESWYFAASQNVYENHNMANLSGDYSVLAEYSPDNGWEMLWETADYFYMADYLRNKENIEIYAINKETGATMIELKQECSGECYIIRATGDGFVIGDSENLYFFDLELKPTKTTPIPKAIKEVLNDKDRFEGNYQFVSGGTWFYSGPQGMYQYDEGTDTHTLMVESYYFEGKGQPGMIFPSSLEVTADGDRLMWMTPDGAHCLDIATGVTYSMPTSYYGNLWGSQSGAGHFSVDSDLGYVQLKFFSYADYSTSTTAIKGVDPYRPLPLYTGRNYTGLGISGINDDGTEKVDFYRVDLATLTVEKLDFVLDRTHTSHSILGITDDGKILLWYTVNPAEQGLLLVG